MHAQGKLLREISTIDSTVFTFNFLIKQDEGIM